MAWPRPEMKEEGARLMANALSLLLGNMQCKVCFYTEIAPISLGKINDFREFNTTPAL